MNEKLHTGEDENESRAEMIEGGIQENLIEAYRFRACKTTLGSKQTDIDYTCYLLNFQGKMKFNETRLGH